MDMPLYNGGKKRVVSVETGWTIPRSEKNDIWTIMSVVVHCQAAFRMTHAHRCRMVQLFKKNKAPTCLRDQGLPDCATYHRHWASFRICWRPKLGLWH